MDDDLICNYKKCRKRLNSHAWVTSCSHIFCDEDGGREFGKQNVCPACETQLPGKFDIIRVELQPSEQYKSMVLAGQRPEMIMEICSRAMSFWVYQAHQERAYQEYCATKAIEKAQQQESYHDQMIAVNQSELTSMKSQVAVMKRDLEEVKTKYNEASEKLMEKSRQYQKLQGMYETLRRRNVTPATFEADHANPRSKFPAFRSHHQYEMPLGTLPERDAGLPHGHMEALQRRQLQPGDFTVHASTAPMYMSGATNLPLQGHPSASMQHPNPSASMQHPNPSASMQHPNYSAIVSSQQSIHHHHIQGKTQDLFRIKMDLPAHGGSTQRINK